MNIIKYLTVLSIIFLVVISCKKQKDINADDLNDLTLVTGITIIDDSGNQVETYGNPNNSNQEYIDDNDGYIGGGSYNYSIYPNPVSDILHISTVEKIESVWIVKGKVTSNYQDFEFADYFNSEVIDTVDIDNNSSLAFNNLTETDELNINLSEEIEDGIYKIIIKTEDSSLFWFAIIKSDEELESIEEKYFPW